MTFDLGFGNAWPAITRHSPASLDTNLTPGMPTMFSVMAMDPDGDPLSYSWTAHAGLSHSTTDSVFWYYPLFQGARDTIRVTVSDGELADSLAWVVTYGTVSGDEPGPVVPGYARLTATPTPFRRSVTLTCAIPSDGEARVSIHDVAGQLVAVVAEGSIRKGSTSWIWDGTRHDGRPASQGVYLAKVEGPGFTARSLLVRMR
jgi:hypothetical protein